MITLLKVKDTNSEWNPLISINALLSNRSHTLRLTKELEFYTDTDCFRIRIEFKSKVLLNGRLVSYAYVTYPDLSTFNIPYSRMQQASRSLSFMRKRLI